MDGMTGGDGSDAAAAVTFTAFAEMIGMSRPYVSKLVALGRITPPALTDDRKIIPALARDQIAKTADPARSSGASSAEADGTYASNRARLAAAQAERAELELRARRGELVERAAVAEVLAPAIRKLRDDLLGVPRETIADADQADACEAAIAAVLERTATEILNHGGAQPGP